MADDNSDDDGGRDIATRPGAGADAVDEISRFVPAAISDLYEVYSYRHAASILANSHADEMRDVATALSSFRITTSDIRAAGGNESDIVKRVTALFRPRGWHETRISADLKVKKETVRRVERTLKSGRTAYDAERDEVIVDIPNFVDGHKVDFVKGRVAFDMEWNSKDQTFDRDLYAFRAFHDCSIISAAILLTRSAALNPVFTSLGGEVKAKYGASTTWMGKLLYRLNAGRNGGCPVLVLGITPRLIQDWAERTRGAP